MYQAIVFLPIIASAIAGLFGRVIGARASELVTTGALFVSAALSIYVFYDVCWLGHSSIVAVAPWIHSSDFAAEWTIRVDSLTAVMLVVVTGVSSLVHLYSIGYMAEDDGRPRFFSYLSLFTFAMLMLVTANNFLQMFFGWEGVGLASYLLIGFWYKKPEANAAAMKPSPKAFRPTASSNGSPPSPPAHRSPTPWANSGSCRPTFAPTCSPKPASPTSATGARRSPRPPPRSKSTPPIHCAGKNAQE